MKIISTIQKRAYIIVVIIALCIIAFLYQDISPNINNIGSGDNYIGKVNGETLEYDEFNKQYTKYEADYKQQKGGQSLTEEETKGLRDQIWSRFVQKNVLGKLLDKLGLAISEKEIVEITRGQNIDPSLKQIPAFMNQYGQFDPMALDNFLKTMNQDEPGTLPGTRKRQWKEFESQMLENRRANKFNAIIENGLYVPKWMSDYDIKLFGTSADIKYTTLPYSSIDIDKIKVDDGELKNYFEENKYKYAALTPTVKLAVASFELKPSFNDSVEIFNKFNTRIEEMRTTANDTAFFKAYGDNGGYNQMYYTMTDLGQHPKLAEMFAAGSRSIVGPYIDKDNVKAFRILNKKSIADSVLIKTIIISFQDVKSQEAQMQRFKLIDSIFKMVDTLNMNFDEIAARYSADRGQTPPQWIRRADKAWNPEIFFHGGATKHFKSAAEREGAIKIVKVINFVPSVPAVQLGEISMPYVPSNETQQATYNKAISMMQKCKTATQLEKMGATHPELNIKSTYVNKEATTVEGLTGNAKDVVRWAFNSKSGDLSSMLQVGNYYVYTGNLGDRSRDNIRLEDVKEDIIPAFKNDKAFKLLAEKMSGSTLEDVANKNKTTVDTLQNFSFSRSTIGASPEPALVAVASGLSLNKVSKPIKGTGGVYRIVKTKANPSTITPADELSTKTQLNQGFKQLRGFVEAIINRYKIDDNRVNIF